MNYPLLARAPFLALIILSGLSAGTAQAQEEKAEKEPFRTRITLGAMVAPTFPGAGTSKLGPYIDGSRARGDTPFDFDAPDESFGPTLIQSGGFSAGPALSFIGSRTAKDVGAALPKVGFTLEAGGFVQYWLVDSLRLRAEARQGIGGHKGLVGVVSADYVARDGDKWLFSVGPRLTLSNAKYNRAYFGVAPADAPGAGLTAFRPKAGAQAAGAVAGALYQLTPRWGLAGFVQYDRLIADPAKSPIVRTYGSRDQYSGGLALTYTFGGHRR
ncbi:MipA/OmpV family protein [Sphingomonas sp. ZT3P38]|uniref:MipA/OmpV family protein n=1 Tax=Parasphingomonas zepuensis TaxID=3096161 RepID=UPI002FC8F261